MRSEAEMTFKQGSPVRVCNSTWLPAVVVHSTWMGSRDPTRPGGDIPRYRRSLDGGASQIQLGPERNTFNEPNQPRGLHSSRIRRLKPG